jgi:hypothetical protein
MMTMNEREEIQKRVQSFREHQLRLIEEREARMNRLAQQTRQLLLEMNGRAGSANAPRA